MERFRDRLVRRWRSEAAMARLVGRILDRRDAGGRFPRAFTHDAPGAERASLLQLLPAAALREAGRRLDVNLAVLEKLLADEATSRGEQPPELEGLFDEVAGRAPRDPRSERRAWTAQVVEALEAGFADGRHRANDAGFAGDDPLFERWATQAHAELGRGAGTFAALGRLDGADAVREAAARLAAAFLLARRARSVGVLRLDDLGRAACGDDDGLAPGSDDHVRLGDVLYLADDEVRAQVDDAGPASDEERRRLTLDALGVVLEDAHVDVLVKGPLDLLVRGQLLGDVTRLSRAGLPAKLTLAALRGATFARTGARVVTTVENERAFRIMTRLAAHDELVVFTGRVPSWAVTHLLRELWAANSALPFRHSGDLDREGVLALRALRQRSGVPVEPWQMDAATFRAHAARAVPLSQEERARTARLRDEWKEPYCGELLDAIVEAGSAVPQEHVLEPPAEPPAPRGEG